MTLLHNFRRRQARTGKDKSIIHTPGVFPSTLQCISIASLKSTTRYDVVESQINFTLDTDGKSPSYRMFKIFQQDLESIIQKSTSNSTLFPLNPTQVQTEWLICHTSSSHQSNVPLPDDDQMAGEYWCNMTLNTLWSLLLRLRFLFYIVWPSETMFPSLNMVPRYVTEMFPIFILVAIFETVVRIVQGRNSLRTNETVGSVSQGIFQECLRIKVRSIEVLMYCLVWDHMRIVALPWNSLITWWICYISVDFGFYWAHRLAHEVNFIWAIHQAHHSSEEFSVVSALRQAVLQPFTAWFTYLPLALVIPPQIFLSHLQLSELYMAWLHTEIVDTIGPLEFILNTPSHHRVHHSRNPAYIDKNYGGMLIIWDRIFGTFKAEDKNDPPVYGLVHPVGSFDPMEIQFHPWRVIWKRIKRATNWRDKLGVVFKGPGWRPGLSHHGNSDELPPIVRPVNTYNPQISSWKNAYVIAHFAFLLFFYHELTLHQARFELLVLNVGVVSLLMSITTLGYMLDNKRRYNDAYELARCLLFFSVRRSLVPIINHGIEPMKFNQDGKMIVLSLIYGFFAISALINSMTLISKLVADHTLRIPSWVERWNQIKKQHKQKIV